MDKLKIRDIGGEFKLIDRETRRFTDDNVVVGVGDDCAVLKGRGAKYLLLTTDMLVEEDHFSLRWHTPYQVGMKAVEVNVSDIAAMGGLPKYMLISLCLTPQTTVEFVDELYKGMNWVCKKYGVRIIGGDTTHGEKVVINITMTGEVEKSRLSLRSDAKAGDLVCVTGDLGKSTAGLELLKAGKKGYTLAHLEPKARLDEAREISKYCNAMIDVSDGLAPDLGHICDESKVGVEVYKEKIPVSEKTVEAASQLGADPVEYALRGGEDFELVFTIPEEDLKKIKAKLPITVIGRITSKKEKLLILDKRIIPLGGGYDHFK
ncbi:MAG: thiamine-phosphate kinase [Candidatus Altiarchaeota archaeon]